jgi:uroporphyrinogen-III decarboxylase
LLSKETWDNVYLNSDVNNIFDDFLKMFLNIFEASFPVIYICNSYSHLITEYKNLTLLGFYNDKHTNWKKHIDQIFQKLNAACFVIGKLFPALNLATL